MKKLFIVLLLAVFALPASAQFGEISGTVTSSEDGLPLPGATVSYYLSGVLHGVSADSAGKFRIKPLSPGVYDIRVSFVTFNTSTVTGVVVSPEKVTYLNVKLSPDNLLPIVEIPWEKPLVDPGEVSDMFTLDAEEIEQHVSRDLRDLVSMAGGVYQEDDGGSLNVRGSREDATQYVVDGVKMTGPFSLPKSAIAEVTVITGGIPAQYGDATGGIVLITTKSYRNRMR